MISEGVSHVFVIFLFLRTEPDLEERSLSLNVCSCDLGFDRETCNRCLFKEPADSTCML